MMKCKKILSLLLAVVMLCSVVTVFTVSVAAEETTTETETEKKNQIDYLTKVFATPEDKLATMKLKLTKGNYQIYCDEYSGEVAVKNTVTGQIISTNPYDVGASNSSESIKYQNLSQIIIKYTDNGKEKEFSSYEYASLRDQITVKNIKNGIRVEYIIGREEARHLVPRWIEDSRFREKILAPMLEYYGGDEDNFYYKKFLAYYGGANGVKDLDACATDRLKQDMLASFPITAEMDIWVFDPTASATEIEKVEELIKAACPEYSYEEMDYDHQLTGYESDETNPPVFKMALEYTLEDDGFTVRLPVNGLTFNESLYQLTNISILPYMGAGNNAYEGYVFYPDGSGTLFSMEDLVNTNTTSVASKIYGADYAYHQITGTYQQVVRYPAFGIVENTQYYECDEYDDDTGEIKTTTISGLIYDKVVDAQKEGTTVPAAFKDYATLISSASEIRPVTVNRGFTAIIEEGDALTNMVYYHSGVLSPYDTVMMNFNPRPQDSYNLADSISVGTNTEWTVITDRKYTGNFKVHYIMLTDETVAEEKVAAGELKADGWYEATWLGMAFAYRDYLVNKGVLSRLTEEETSGDIPMYIEAFGSLETIEKIASIPVTVKKALTSAADIITMYEELSADGVTNINFKLTGFANGGMYAKMPYRLKWERAVSKDTSMQELFDYAASVTDGNLGIFPDFDFSYVNETGLFDGLSLRKHAVKTIDDRYTNKRQYMPTQQRYMSVGMLAISPAYFSHFYEKLVSNYLKYDNVTGISVGTLGSDLNSDFDEDEPFNREDSRGFVQKALDYLSSEEKSNLEVMVDGGNVYTWQYVDHILDVALDSSRYIRSSYSVPFIGVVLHGYMNFAGSPLNMEGDVNYAKLKAIENGASLYFTLSYTNTELLKEWYLLSQYYSIRYDIWYDDVVEIYNEVNGVLKDVQDKLIIDHEFLSGMRVPDTDELENDILAEFEQVLDYQINKDEYERQQQSQAVADARKNIASVQTSAKDFINSCITNYSSISGAAYLYVTGERSYERRLAAYTEANAAYQKVLAEYEAASAEDKEALSPLLISAETTQKQALAQLKTYVRNISRAILTLETEYENLTNLLKVAEEGQTLIGATEGVPQSIIDEAREQLESARAMIEQQLGVRFNLTVDKAEVDTFLYVHISNLLYSCYGENTAGQIGVIGKGEKLYEMLAQKEYGLTEVDYVALRYLDANKDLTDAELAAKYGIVEGSSSVSGLILHLRELLGDAYVFDPILSDEKGANGLSEVDENVLGYFLNILYTSVSGLSDNSVVPALNFDPTRVNEKGKVVANTTNINKLTTSINSIISKQITALLSGVTDGNYSMDAVVSADVLNKAVADCVKIITKAGEEGADPFATYLTPDTIESDVRNYIEGKYYQAVIALMKPEGTVDSLSVITVSTKSDSSLAALANNRLNAYGKTEGFKAALEAMLKDDTLNAKLSIVAEEIKDMYGDVSDNIAKAYAKAYATLIVGSLDDKSKPTFDFKDAGLSTSDKAALNEEFLTYVTEAVATASVDDLGGIIADLVAKLKQHTFADSVDLEAEATEFVYYVYLVKLADTEVISYYYDSQMGAMDATIRAAVAAKHDQIVANITENTTDYEVYDMILHALGDVESFSEDYNSLTAFTKDVASRVTYYISGNYSMASDVQSYYIYLLFQSFSEYLMDEVPTLSLYDGNKLAATNSTKYKNAIKYFDKDFVQTPVSELVAAAKTGTARGELPDYALTRLKTDEEMSEWVNEIYEKLLAGMYLTDAQSEEGEAKDALCAEISAYIRYYYYNAVLTKLSAAKETTFHVSEVYGDDLYTASEKLKTLLRYYVTTTTTMTEKDIDDMIRVVTVIEDEEEEDPSKYLSADGRIVAVTYGEKTSNGSYEGYKTFLLNYNNFSVSVVYDGITYTIPAYGYVVVMR